MKKFLLLLLLVAHGNIANAQTLEMTANHWRVFTLKNGNAKTCYIASVPVRSSGSFKKRGEPYIMVTNRSATNDEVSVSSGYHYKVASDVELNVDGKITKLFVKDDRAWAKDAATDAALVQSMKSGTIMNAKGFSRVGSNSVDNYSLSGFTAAYNKMKELCK